MSVWTPASKQRIPPGLIVVATGEGIRSTNMAASMVRTVVAMDPESAVMWSIGATVADNLNDGMRALVAHPHLDYVWTIGDDHEWDAELLPALLQRMYEEDYDILVPLCYRRSWPPNWVIYDRKDEEGVVWPTTADTIAEILDSGDYTREVEAAGNAGMLIRRRVIEKLEDPWWRNGLEGPGKEIISQAGEDINFCEDAKAAGFRIHAAFDLPLGHIANVGLAPEMIEGRFGMRMFFGTTPGPFLPLSGEATDDKD